jgi:hypothetical protein
MSVTFASADELAQALVRAEQAHGQYEKQLGHRDDDWPIWYARFLVEEQNEGSGAGSDDSSQ